MRAIAATAVANLRCKYLENPLGIDATQPRLSWIIESDKRAQKQTAYQVLVAGDEDKLRANQCDLLHSDKVASEKSCKYHTTASHLTHSGSIFYKC